jgi:hypothetical protein
MQMVTEWGKLEELGFLPEKTTVFQMGGTVCPCSTHLFKGRQLVRHCPVMVARLSSLFYSFCRSSRIL